MVIVKVWMGAVIHDRPVSWACRRSNWPPYERWNRPADATMSRRLRSVEVRFLLEQIERRVLRPDGVNNLVWIVDGGRIVQSFIKAGLVEDMTVTFVPILLGDGLRLFGEVDSDIDLKLVKSRAFQSGLVSNHYELVYSS